jgi:hypothetical protein
MSRTKNSEPNQTMNDEPKTPTAGTPRRKEFFLIFLTFL